jgi:predicted alpha-1,6-mannanase (GH76 family)
MAITGDLSYMPVVEGTFSRAPRRGRRGFVNEFFDDCGWWGLAWIAAYDLTGASRYLDTASAIFSHMVTGWDDTLGGGVWWSAARDYKNAITNELFGLLAARLHVRTGRGEYLDWALRSWSWFAASGMTGASGLVNDGLTPDGRNKGATTWTYNQGVVLGFAAELHAVTGSDEYLRAGRRTASATLRALTADGILTEPVSGEPDGDAVQFKGIFVRNLRVFAEVADLDGYREFILANAASAWANARDEASDQIGFRWAGPFDRADAGRQSSALDLFNAAAPPVRTRARSDAADS